MLTQFAGNSYGPGNADGLGAAASFDFPRTVALDAAGNLHVTDANGIRRITPGGAVTTAFEIGSVGVAFDRTGNLYTVDGYSVLKITPIGIVTTLAGVRESSGRADGTGDQARFQTLVGVAVDSVGNVFVADSNAAIRRITPAGEVSTFAGRLNSRGNVDGTGDEARFFDPLWIAIDGSDNLYVTERTSESVRKITPTGVVTTMAGLSGSPPGNADGFGSAARFREPRGVAADTAGNVYVVDGGNDSIRKITPAGLVTTLARPVGLMTPTAGGESGLAVDGSGTLYVANSARHVVLKVTPGGLVTTLAGNAPLVGSTDGLGAAAGFSAPTGIATDSEGNVLVADTLNGTIRSIAPSGMASTLAGSPGKSGSADGTGSGAILERPAGVVVDGYGELSISDGYLQVLGAGTFDTSRIRRVTRAGEVKTLVQTGGRLGAIDSAGNLYATRVGAVLKITPMGVVTTFAGKTDGTGSADGIGEAARFGDAQGLALDTSCNVYVADSKNNTIRKISPMGVVTTLAGTSGTAGAADGAGVAARFNAPKGLASDSAGNIYVADSGNFTIRKITSDGTVTTVAGTAGVENFLPGGLPVQIAPQWIALSGRSLYFTNNNGVAVIRNIP